MADTPSWNAADTWLSENEIVENIDKKTKENMKMEIPEGPEEEVVEGDDDDEEEAQVVHSEF